MYINNIQSTLVILKSKRPSEILRDIRTSTYQICIIEIKINWTATFHKRICYLTPEVRDISKSVENASNECLSVRAQIKTLFSLHSLGLCDLHMRHGTFPQASGYLNTGHNMSVLKFLQWRQRLLVFYIFGYLLLDFHAKLGTRFFTL